MIVYRISVDKYASDLSGTGSRLYGGRWTPKGFPVLYTASNPSLALLELYVHIKNSTPPNLKLIKLAIDEKYLTKKALRIPDLPSYWNDNPAPEALQLMGQEWITESKTLIMEVPSSIMPEDTNYIVNVGHKDFTNAVSMLNITDCPLDKRLI